MAKMLVTLPKKKKKQPDKKYFQKKADQYLQEILRKVHGDAGCEVCGGQYSCGHHFLYKSESTGLRYDFMNLIPICNTCHFKIHNTKGNLTASKIATNRGAEWLYNLETKKKELAGQKFGLHWYRQKYEELKNALDIMK